MPRLIIDALTAGVSLQGLQAQGHDLTTLAQSLDEEWKRHSVDPATGTTHLISTMGNRRDCPPYGRTYYNTQLIQPDARLAEDRQTEERFLRGKPRFCGRLDQLEDGYLLDTAILEITPVLYALIDRNKEITTFFHRTASVPSAVIASSTGKKLRDVMRVPSGNDLEIVGMRTADKTEMEHLLGLVSEQALAIETPLPAWTEVTFNEVYPYLPHWSGRN